MKYKIIGLLIVSQVGCAYAANVNMVNAAANVRNLSTSLLAIEMLLKTPAIFPAIIPAPVSAMTVYYASVNLNSPNRSIKYVLNIDASPQCHGAHYCNIGSLMAQIDVAPQAAGQGTTKTVALNNSVLGFYTAGSAAGDYFPAQLQWLSGNMLYTLSWNLPQAVNDSDQQNAFVQMANSALAQLPAKVGS